MISTLFCLGVLLTLSTVVTLVAIVRAKDGFEDELGFHAESRTDREEPEEDRISARTAPLPTCTGVT
jgi:hypothetical protein